MERLYKPHRVVEILDRYGFKFSKSLGQNFLIDGNIVRKIVDVAEVEGKNVLEIGPGLGTLTEELAMRAKKVLAIEIDKKLIPVHEETLKLDNVKVIYDDFLKLDLKILEEEFEGESFVVVSNLPYYVTTPILTRIIEQTRAESITVMVQKEVARRFSAKPSTKDYGSLSVFVQFYSDVKYEFDVPSTVFMPRPRVDSGVVRFKLKDDLAVVDREKLFKIVKASFSKRRKTIINSLSTYGFDICKDIIENVLKISNIDSKRRAETLTPEEFIVLTINFPKI
ncbi:MAG: 16S rRNA (adenine(1518)-N(6)/adenine(1519)-N(6))-dimethyltransferase RsmA [Peptoniphilus sp.]|uniref:Ribosomal RNA small subunit methyltransferase A n=2 Tax=Peptoniphilus indolicus TaxID=33030 RepID=G4D4P6_9FIRM|nr:MULTISPECIES: 16S rRNA (adenine(1518)-N(6)/adenine(1519)-N(6))-dimethyltransferase RsmA [Peptoniphilus]EGY79504.1 dimethyladenosine transferase [Peptoniphilus indolicus ATCC 29427]MDY2986065.1 16S rRNA (adenine(1518)-N(6)/adenine(1519)-N(6))-dimethyltransferase RsmA [Peptoniphilus sp.]SUB74666.1 Ribosomal RNA small subunit methyltransferase A [Peptoniphilus indolicus]